jgi:protein TonB
MLPLTQLAPDKGRKYKMLDQLVESKSNAGENARRSGFLLTTFVILVSALVSVWVYSLFAKDYGVSGDLELSELVAPVPIAEEEPPPPEPEEPEKKQVVQEKQVDMSVRKENILRLDESPQVPPKVSVEQPTAKARPKGNFIVDPNATEVTRTSAPTARTGDVGDGGQGFALPPKPVEKPAEKPDEIPPPPPKPKPPPPSKPISKGVVNGSAISLPKPPYPAAARAVRASGAVNVQVLINESGSVVSANAVSGHPLLRQAAESAARGAKFKPTLLSGQPVKVNGVIVYNFVP